MRIAVDAMGGDFAPHEIVKGAVQAATELPGVSRIILVGDSAQIEQELQKAPSGSSKLEIHHASQVVGMDEPPALAVRRKKDSSIGRAVDMVKAGDADAMVSAGNTGAVVVASTLKLRTLAGVERPAIAIVMPTPKRPCVLLDAGANLDSSPKMLCQYALMGTVYSQAILGQSKPVVGLLSIGGEEVKGTGTTKEAFKLLSGSALNFRGNVEGHDLYRGDTDVVVCDGFVGNVVLKTSESVAHAIGHWMKEEFKASPVRMLGAFLLSGALRAMKGRLDPELHGGALLLGVRGICIITHGASSAKAIYHAVRVACESGEHNMNESIARGIAEMGGIG